MDRRSNRIRFECNCIRSYESYANPNCMPFYKMACCSGLHAIRRIACDSGPTRIQFHSRNGIQLERAAMRHRESYSVRWLVCKVGVSRHSSASLRRLHGSPLRDVTFQRYHWAHARARALGNICGDVLRNIPANVPRSIPQTLSPWQNS